MLGHRRLGLGLGDRWACPGIPEAVVTFEPREEALGAWQEVKGEAMSVNEALYGGAIEGPRPIGSNKTCINAHAHTPHSARNTPTCLIRPNKLFFFFFFLSLRLIVKKECFDLALMWAITGLFFRGHFRSLITRA